MSSAAERQRQRSQRMRERGYVRIGMWIPREVHAHCMREANQLGISLEDRVIQKLRG